MINIIDRINLVIDKIGKRNFLLVIFVLVAVLVGGLYGTFSLFTATDGVSIIDGITTMKFILNSDNTTNSVTIAAGSSKFVALTISNPEKIKLKYGIYYSSNNDLTDVDLGYLYNSEYISNDVISADQDYIVNVKIKNDSLNNVTINFGIAYGLESGGDLVLPDGNTWLDVYGELASVYIQDLYNDGSKVDIVKIGNSTDNTTVSLNKTQGIMLDNNNVYRYYGATPNNYVSYNDELWRIISVSNVKSSISDKDGEIRVKIVRNDSIGTYSYDSSDESINFGYGVNDWSSSDLMNELNNFYYNKQVSMCYNGENNASSNCDFSMMGLNDEAKSLTADALYYLGGESDINAYYANNYFTLERGLNVYPATTEEICNDGSCPRTTMWSGRVGIMYPSDYAYATDLSVCLSDGSNYNLDSLCLDNVWINNSNLWFITPNSDFSYNAFSLDDGGKIVGNSVSSAKAVYPVQYLKSNVIIRSGSGAIEDPYILELS